MVVRSFVCCRIGRSHDEWQTWRMRTYEWNWYINSPRINRHADRKLTNAPDMDTRNDCTHKMADAGQIQTASIIAEAYFPQDNAGEFGPR